VPAEPPAAQTLEAHGITPEEARGLGFFKGKGCPTCNTIGFRGRRAVFETMPASTEVREAVEQGATAEAIEKAALESGMIGIRERCLALVRNGTTSFEEFARLRL
jgi:type IV pilus assembly protein PilB